MSSPESDADISTSTLKDNVHSAREALQRRAVVDLSRVLESSLRSVSPELPDSTSSPSASGADEKNGAHSSDVASLTPPTDSTGRKNIAPHTSKKDSIFSPDSNSKDNDGNECVSFEWSGDEIIFKFNSSSECPNARAVTQRTSDMMVTVDQDALAHHLGISTHCKEEMLSDLVSRLTSAEIAQNPYIQINIIHPENTLPSKSARNIEAGEQSSEVRKEVTVFCDDNSSGNRYAKSKKQSTTMKKQGISNPKNNQQNLSNQEQEEFSKPQKRKSLASKSVNTKTSNTNNPNDMDYCEEFQSSHLSIQCSKEADYLNMVEDNVSNEDTDEVFLSPQRLGKKRLPFGRKSDISEVNAAPRKGKKKILKDSMLNLDPSFSSGTDSTSGIRGPRQVKFSVSMRDGLGGDVESSHGVQSDHPPKRGSRGSSEQHTPSEVDTSSIRSKIRSQRQEEVPTKATEMKSQSLSSTPRLSKKAATRKNVCNLRASRKSLG